jgi:hypothetical protein
VNHIHFKVRSEVPIGEEQFLRVKKLLRLDEQNELKKSVWLNFNDGIAGTTRFLNCKNLPLCMSFHVRLPTFP